MPVLQISRSSRCTGFAFRNIADPIYIHTTLPSTRQDKTRQWQTCAVLPFHSPWELSNPNSSPQQIQHTELHASRTVRPAIISSSRTRQANRQIVLDKAATQTSEKRFSSPIAMKRKTKTTYQTSKQASSKNCGLFEINVQKTELGNEREKALSLISAALSVAGLLVGISVPYNVVGQAVHLFACTLGHLCEAFCLGLVLEGVGREINACDVS